MPRSPFHISILAIGSCLLVSCATPFSRSPDTPSKGTASFSLTRAVVADLTESADLVAASGDRARSELVYVPSASLAVSDSLELGATAAFAMVAGGLMGSAKYEWLDSQSLSAALIGEIYGGYFSGGSSPRVSNDEVVSRPATYYGTTVASPFGFKAFGASVFFGPEISLIGAHAPIIVGAWPNQSRTNYEFKGVEYGGFAGLKTPGLKLGRATLNLEATWRLTHSPRSIADHAREWKWSPFLTLRLEVPPRVTTFVPDADASDEFSPVE